MTVQILQGDCRDVLKTLPAESVHCVVTSPPFWGLRDYKVENQMGLEETPQAYVAALVEVFHEVWRVLRKDGTVWLNLGDCFAGSWANYGGRNRGSGKQRSISVGSIPSPAWDGREAYRPPATKKIEGLKPKDLIGVPWRVAFALQEDGWWLRSDIIWAKKNVMPESVQDRPTRAHEYLFLLTKSPRYYYDAVAIREPMAPVSIGRYGYAFGGAKNEQLLAGENPTAMVGSRDASLGANKRDVWHIATKPFSGAHFAVYPEELIEPCILAGTSDKGRCAECGAPWERQVRCEAPAGAAPRSASEASNAGTGLQPHSGYRGIPIIQDDGWQPTCAHDADVVPCTVLDPFAGSGTTLRVAAKHRRDAIGIELNPEYIELIEKRIQTEVALPLIQGVA